MSKGARNLPGVVAANMYGLQFPIYPKGGGHRLIGLVVNNPTNIDYFAVGRGTKTSDDDHDEHTIAFAQLVKPGLNRFDFGPGITTRVRFTADGIPTEEDGLYIDICTDALGTDDSETPSGWDIIGFYK